MMMKAGTRTAIEAAVRVVAALLGAGLVVFFCSGCASSVPWSNEIRVDTGANRLVYQGRSMAIEWSRKRRHGSRLGSGLTPVGRFVVDREPGHRFGPVLRPRGYQGEVRGILVHRDLSRGWGTRGCVALVRREDMEWLFARVTDGTEMVIY